MTYQNDHCWDPDEESDDTPEEDPHELTCPYCGLVYESCDCGSEYDGGMVLL